MTTASLASPNEIMGHGILPETFDPRTPHPYLHFCYSGQVLIPRRGYGTTPLHRVAIPWPLHLQINGAWLKAPCRPMGCHSTPAIRPTCLVQKDARDRNLSCCRDPLPRAARARAAYPPAELVPTPAEDASLGKLPSDLPWRLGPVTISRNAAVPAAQGPGGRESRHVSPWTYRPGIQHG